MGRFPRQVYISCTCRGIFMPLLIMHRKIDYQRDVQRKNMYKSNKCQNVQTLKA